jgi:Sulfotransferase family/Aspartyl/Asparaginyl beta-hydroxylase
MRLPRPFYRLPVRFDASRLQSELEALPDTAWARHPKEFEGNASIRLISVDGAENDGMRGVMRPTPHLQACPYVRQVLASFGVVWSRSRFMRLSARSNVPEHADTSYHWFQRVRIHIPVVTWPEVRFSCGDETVHMAPGEAWLFDNWRRHTVVNPTDHERVHLVADTFGNSRFWQFVAESTGVPQDRRLDYRPELDAHVLTELAVARPVMPPAEVELLVQDIIGELRPAPGASVAAENVQAYAALLLAFCRDWRQVYALHGESPAGLETYRGLLLALQGASRKLAQDLVMRTNLGAAHSVLENRVLSHALRADQLAKTSSARRSPARSTTAVDRGLRLRLDRPIVIVEAPRSGSTLLFETLAVSPSLCTLGGEAHWLVENIPELRPGAPGVDSNRLRAEHATESIALTIDRMLAKRMLDSNQRPVAPESTLRWLEKTPKNALRIPFFDRLYGDALFILLWRDPRENLSSIIEAWKARRWVTYPALDGWNGAWSLLLPPGWRDLKGRPLPEIAAAQWEVTNRTALADLRRLPAQRWMSLRYSDLVANPRHAIERICQFTGIEFDSALDRRVAGPLPVSRHTQTAPAPDKWRRNEQAVLGVLPSLEATWRELEALDAETRVAHGADA